MDAVLFVNLAAVVFCSLSVCMLFVSLRTSSPFLRKTRLTLLWLNLAGVVLNGFFVVVGLFK